MPREIVIASWCDACHDDGGKKEPSVATYAVGIAAGEVRPTPHVVLACEVHRKPIEDLLALLGHTEVLKVGPARSAAAAAPQRDGDITRGPRLDCAVCGKDIARVGYLHHIYTQHAFTQRPISLTTCPVCHRRFTDPSVCTRHRIADHGYDQIAEALAQVKGYRP